MGVSPGQDKSRQDLLYHTKPCNWGHMIKEQSLPSMLRASFPKDCSSLPSRKTFPEGLRMFSGLPSTSRTPSLDLYLLPHCSHSGLCGSFQCPAQQIPHVQERASLSVGAELFTLSCSLNSFLWAWIPDGLGLSETLDLPGPRGKGQELTEMGQVR